MRINVKGFITCKESESPSDCADNYAYNLITDRFAISDGVTKSFFPKIWSQLLVNNFVALEGATELSIESCQSEWLEQVTEKINAPNAKWFSQNAFYQQKPGLATFVSLRFDFNNKKWFANALGDSFLFFIPKGKEDSFADWIKLSSKAEPVVFDNFPDYYSSRGQLHHGESKSHVGQFEYGRFYLMTDALSEWVFKEKENALNRIEEKWKSQSEFESSINDLRNLKLINDDDSTVLIINIEDDGNSKCEYGEENVTNIKDLIANEKKQTKKEKPVIITYENFKKKETHVQKKEDTNDKSTNFSEANLSEIKKEFSQNIHDTEEECLNKTTSESDVELSHKEQDSKEDQESINISSETNLILSKKAQDIYNICITIYDKAIQQIGDKITLKRMFRKEFCISEDEQKIVKQKLISYGISFKE